MTQPLKCILEGTLQTLDLSKPDGLNVIWPLPRDPKIDFHVILTKLLEQNGLQNISVVTEPTFEPSLLHDKDGHWSAVIALTRGTDSARRVGIGEQVYLVINDGDGNLVDVTAEVINAMTAGAPVDFYGQAADSTVNIDIYSINTQLSEQLYIFVKIALLAAEKPYFFDALGYLDVLRRNGRDEVSGIDFSGGTHIIAARSMEYQTTTLEYIANQVPLVSVIQQTYVAQTVQPGAALATVVASPPPTTTSVTVDSVAKITLNMSLFIGTQLTTVMAINAQTLTVGPLVTVPNVGDPVVGISTAQQSVNVPPG